MSVQRWLMAPAMVVLASLIAACGNTGNGGGGAGTPSRPTTSAPGAVTIIRSGGIAGVNEKVEIAPDGSWVYTDIRRNRTEQGSLSAGQRVSLLQLVSDPNFADELRRPQSTGMCSDAFLYTISAGGLSATYEQGCGDSRTAVEAVINAVADATPL